MSWSLASAQPGDPFNGVWLLDAARCDFGPGIVLERSMLSILSSPDRVDVVVEAVAADGRQLRIQYGGAFDAVPRPSSGSPTFDAVSFRRLEATVIERTDWKAGQPVARQTASIQGEALVTRTVTVPDAAGAPQAVLVYVRRAGNP